MLHYTFTQLQIITLNFKMLHSMQFEDKFVKYINTTHQIFLSIYVSGAHSFLQRGEPDDLEVDTQRVATVCIWTGSIHGGTTSCANRT
jgi:hypothetical protein